jgi:hypothetical protein
MFFLLVYRGFVMMVEVGDSEGGVGARNNDSCGIVAFVWTDTIVRFNPLAMASSTVLLI